MPIDLMVARSMGNALWDPRPTKTDRRAQHLAAALGYPEGWRVVRTIEKTATHPVIILDRIYAGDPEATEGGCDCWFHHAAAQRAAAAWEENGRNPHATKGGHLLPRQAKFNKGDKVQAFFEDEWWDAKIVRRKEHPVLGWRYQVHYAADKSKQSGVPEEFIRFATGSGSSKKNQGVDPEELAIKLGFGEGWQAEAKGGNRYKITDPNGKVYTSKTKALEAIANDTANSVRGDDGDPPWRTEGHEWIGRKVIRRHEQAVTARRKVTVIQQGTVMGFIAATDVDKAGNPGYRSEKTGEPAPLFHVVYEDDPNHPYPSYLIDFQDLETAEIQEMLEGDAVDDGKPANPTS